MECVLRGNFVKVFRCPSLNILGVVDDLGYDSPSGFLIAEQFGFDDDNVSGCGYIKVVYVSG